ncbi:MAG: HAD hydrolase family protein [Candidatus Komeilibacteria bacterium]|nr:HAD hydrolase family protein [Candidatus Komeilibacteria bacterium]
MENTITKVIKNLVLDVDGVLTTGQFLYTAEGKFAKVFGPHDNDGIKMISKFLTVCAITADKRGLPITQKRVAEDMKLRLEVVSEEERLQWFKDNFDLSQTIYMGDGIFDAQVFPLVVYSIAPQNAFYLAKAAASYVTTLNSGEGAVAEACLHIRDKFFNV